MFLAFIDIYDQLEIMNLNLLSILRIRKYARFAYMTFLLIFMPFLSNAQMPDFTLIGFGAMNGGTQGGQAGDTVVATTFDELNTYCTSAKPYFILIDRAIKGSNPDSSKPQSPVRRIIKMSSDKTLLGVDDKAFLNQISLIINSQHNIIIRNIRFTMKDVPIDISGSEVKIKGTNSDPDIISISADLSSIPAEQRYTNNFWIDHCEFYNEDPNIMTDKDRYDGLVDIKNNCQFISISWCYFHDHHKGCLSGSGNSDNYDRNVTMHHNLFDNIASRIPLQRYGKLHFFNNYIVNSDNGVNVRIQSQALLEKNYFKATKKPIFGKPSEGGTGRELENYFSNCDRLSSVHLPSVSSPTADPLSDSEEYSTNDYMVTYAYDAFLTDVAEVPQLVTNWAGIGKIRSISTSTGQIEKSNNEPFRIYPTLVTDELLVTTDSDHAGILLIEILNQSGVVVLKKLESAITKSSFITVDMRHLPSGIYYCSVSGRAGKRVEKVFKQ